MLGKYIARRGLRGNVYTAQFQLQALYAGGEQEAALELLTNRTDKGWAHMVYDLGATMSTELFDPSQGFTFTYSHPWSSSPANIIVRDMMGIIPLEAAFQRFQIKPQPGSLRYASLTTPTIKGSISVRFRRFVGDCLFELKTVTPVNTLATVYVPAAGTAYPHIWVDGAETPAVLQGDYYVLEEIGSGEHVFRVMQTAAEEKAGIFCPTQV